VPVPEERVTYNPLLEDAGIPQDAPQFPVGALDELQELGLSPAHYPSCSEPNPMIRNRGCDYWFQCPMSYKGKPSAEGGGPRRHAWEIARRGKPLLRVEGECWDIAKRIGDIQDNKGAVRIIADEGESYQKLTGIAVKTFVDPQTDETKKVIAKNGEYHLPNVRREDMVVDFVVKPFPRPAENTAIATDVVTAQAVRSEQERIRGEAFPRALGVTGGGTPLDKRNRKRDKGEGSGS
jgi:hypothetical protein